MVLGCICSTIQPVGEEGRCDFTGGRTRKAQRLDCMGHEYSHYFLVIISVNWNNQSIILPNSPIVVCSPLQTRHRVTTSALVKDKTAQAERDPSTTFFSVCTLVCIEIGTVSSHNRCHRTAHQPHILHPLTNKPASSILPGTELSECRDVDVQA